MAATEKQINELARKIGITLINSGTKMMRSAYDLKPQMFTSATIKSFLVDQLGANPNNISLADSLYAVIDWETWQWVKDWDLIDQCLYYADTFDCDNFASAFASRATVNFLLNSCAVSYGNILDVNTKQVKFRHAFNLIVVQNAGLMQLILYEPQTDEFKLWEKGKDNILPILGIYKPDWMLMG